MFARKNILLIYLMAVGASSLLFYLFPPGYYDRNASLLVTVLMVFKGQVVSR